MKNVEREGCRELTELRTMTDEIVENFLIASHTRHDTHPLS